MKYLYIIRHANSRWAEAGMSDKDRPLDEKGKLDASLMAQHLSDLFDAKLSLIYSSPATRALSTANFFHKTFNVTQEIDIRADIYSGNLEDIIDIVAQTDNSYNNIAIFGHNPTFTFLLNHLASANVDNLPPCGIAILKIITDDWKSMSTNIIELVDVLSPETLSH